MIALRHCLAASVAVAAVFAPHGAALAAADCAAPVAGAVVAGQALRVEPGPARAFTADLAAGQGLIIDLASLSAPGKESDSAEDADGEQARPRELRLCDATGVLLAPLAGDVFEKGSSLSRTPDGTRLRFVAPATGRYTLWLAPSPVARELLVRNRDLGAASVVQAAKVGSEVRGRTSSASPSLVSFAATAGQWVELKAVSESDTVLHLAGPDRSGTYTVLASNDDSEGLNPRIRRRIPVTGTYYVQVDSLSDDADDYTLGIKAVAAPPPPAPPAALRPGVQAGGRLAGTEDVRLFALPVSAGHAYRIELTADHDAVLAIGVPSPIEGEGDKDGPAGGIAEIRTQDSGLSGTERLNFTARADGQVVVLVRTLGIGETDGGFRLVATDLGG